MMVLSLRRSQHIAIVEMEGTIGPRIRANEYARLLRSLEQSERVRAVVLDIDSPGGAASASEQMYLATKSLARTKPVIAFIRGLGASGAYMLSCGAARIVAIPTAIIGSIGVISLRPLVYQALDRIGVRMTVTKSDRLKDMGSMFREPTEEEKQKEQALVDELCGRFVDIVVEGRHLERDVVRQLATGEIYTAARGHELGLIDELGDIERAIDLAAEMGKAPRRPVWVRPRRGLRDLIGPLVVGSFAEEIASHLEDLLARNAFYQRYS